MKSEFYNIMRQRIENYAIENGLTIPLYTEYDNALVGVELSDPELPVAVYSEEKIISILTEMFDGDQDEALEWYHYNVRGAIIAQNPIVINTLEDY